MREYYDWCGEFLRFAKQVNWPMTRVTLELAQLRVAVRDTRAAERLWTEENA